MESRLATYEQERPSPGAIQVDRSTSVNEDVRQKRMQENARPAPPSLITVQGGSLKTWSFSSPAVERVQVMLKTEGRPLDADVELWQGPDNIPYKMRVYTEDGHYRPFRAVIETPRGPNTIAVRNTGMLEFPIAAGVAAEGGGFRSPNVVLPQSFELPPRVIQGGALRTYPFDYMVESVKVYLRTDGRPLNARIELLQGPNNNKQVMEVYTEDGTDRPFSVVIDTPGAGNVVRVVNTGQMEFPITAAVEPHEVHDRYRHHHNGDDRGDVQQWGRESSWGRNSSW